MRRSLVPTCLCILALITGCGRESGSAEDGAAPDTGAGASLEIIAQGQFEDRGGQSTSGAYRIERSGAGLRLVLSDDFRTDEGPDLHVVLSPTPAEDAGNENALAGGEALVVGPLEAQEGTQSYDLPAGTRPADYHSVLIHCVEFTHLYGSAPITPPESPGGL